MKSHRIVRKISRDDSLSNLWHIAGTDLVRRLLDRISLAWLCKNVNAASALWITLVWICRLEATALLWDAQVRLDLLELDWLQIVAESEKRTLSDIHLSIYALDACIMRQQFGEILLLNLLFLGWFWIVLGFVSMLDRDQTGGTRKLLVWVKIQRQALGEPFLGCLYSCWDPENRWPPFVTGGHGLVFLPLADNNISIIKHLFSERLVKFPLMSRPFLTDYILEQHFYKVQLFRHLDLIVTQYPPDINVSLSDRIQLASVMILDVQGYLLGFDQHWNLLEHLQQLVGYVQVQLDFCLLCIFIF